MIPIIDTMRFVTWLAFAGALGIGAAVLGFLVAVGMPAAIVPMINADSTHVLEVCLAVLFAAGLAACLIALVDRSTVGAE